MAPMKRHVTVRCVSARIKHISLTYNNKGDFDGEWGRRLGVGGVGSVQERMQLTLFAYGSRSEEAVSLAADSRVQVVAVRQFIQGLY